MELKEDTNINIFLDKNNNIKSDVDLFDINEMKKDILNENKNIDILSDSYLDNIVKINDMYHYDIYLEDLRLIFEKFQIFKTKNIEVSDDISKIREFLSLELKDYENRFEPINNELNNIDNSYPILKSDNYFDSLRNENNILIGNKKKKKLKEDLEKLSIKIKICKSNIDIFSKYNFKDNECLDIIKNNILIVLDKLETKCKDNEINFNRRNIDLAIKIVKYEKKINIKYNYNYFYLKSIDFKFLYINCLLLLVINLNLKTFIVLIFGIYFVYNKFIFINNSQLLSIDYYKPIKYHYFQLINYTSKYINHFILLIFKLYTGTSYLEKIKFITLNIFFFGFIFHINNFNIFMLSLLNYIMLTPKIFNYTLSKIKII